MSEESKTKQLPKIAMRSRTEIVGLGHDVSCA